MSFLVLIRHGQSLWNLENRFTGWVDIPLTDIGRREAEQAGAALRDVRFHRAFTSDLVRAQETLQIVMRIIGQNAVPVVSDRALNERHYGALQGLNKADTAKKYGNHQVHLWRRSFDIPPPSDKTDLNPEGISESLKDTAARAIPFFEKSIFPHVLAMENVLVVAHGNSLRSIVMHLDHLSRDQVLDLNLDTGVPLLYSIDPAGRVLDKQIRRAGA